MENHKKKGEEEEGAMKEERLFFITAPCMKYADITHKYSTARVWAD